MTILEKIQANLSSLSERTVIESDDASLTYAELARDVARAATHLSRRSGERIGIWASNTPSTYALILGTWFSGNTFVPLHPENPPERNRWIAEAAGVSEILYAGEPPPHVFAPSEAINPLSAAGSAPIDLRRRIADLRPDDSAYILFTSGSTGFPKGVQISWRALESFALGFLKLPLGLRSDGSERFLQMFDLTFDLSILCYIVPLLVGGSIHLPGVSPTKPLAVFRTLRRREITFALFAPSVVTLLKDRLAGETLPLLRTSVFCGEALTATNADLWQRVCPNGRIWNAYGPTEATILCSVCPCGESVRTYQGVVALGRPFGKNRFHLFDEGNLEIHEPLLIGELGISGPQLTSGYLDPTLNPRSFLRKPDGTSVYLTGDLAFKDESGDFLFCGRRDSQIKIQGHRLELQEIELVAAAATGALCVVVFKPNGGEEPGVGAVHLFVDRVDCDLRRLRDALSAKLPAYAVPATITVVEGYRYTNHGKIGIHPDVLYVGISEYELLGGGELLLDSQAIADLMTYSRNREYLAETAAHEVVGGRWRMIFNDLFPLHSFARHTNLVARRAAFEVNQATWREPFPISDYERFSDELRLADPRILPIIREPKANLRDKYLGYMWEAWARESGRPQKKSVGFMRSSLRRFVSLGRRVHILLLPAHSSIRTDPRLTVYREELASLIEEFRPSVASVIDLRTVVRDRDFFDGLHVSDVGRQQATEIFLRLTGPRVPGGHP